MTHDPSNCPSLPCPQMPSPRPADYRGDEYLSVYHFAPGHEHDQSARHVGSFSACQYDACSSWRHAHPKVAVDELAHAETAYETLGCFDPPPLDTVERHVYPGMIALVPLTAPQLAILIDGMGSAAGQLADDPL